MNLAFNSVNVVNLQELGLLTAEFNINAVNTGSLVKSVRFSNTRDEGAVPFAYCGNSGPTYFTCADLVVGATVNITVTPFPLAGQQGTPFPPITTTIQIIQGEPSPPPPTTCTVPKV